MQENDITILKVLVGVSTDQIVEAAETFNCFVVRGGVRKYMYHFCGIVCSILKSFADLHLLMLKLFVFLCVLTNIYWYVLL